MIGGRRLLVLALILGVLGMHALVVLPAAPDTGEPMPMPVAPAATHHVPVPLTVGTHDTPTLAPTIGLVADPPGHGDGHGSMPSMPSMHHVLHLCLAVLAALMVLGLAALGLWPPQGPGPHEISIGALARRVPRRRPPPTSVRLAQLCVLRT